MTLQCIVLLIVHTLCIHFLVELLHVNLAVLLVVLILSRFMLFSEQYILTCVVCRIFLRPLFLPITFIDLVSSVYKDGILQMEIQYNTCFRYNNHNSVKLLNQKLQDLKVLNQKQQVILKHINIHENQRLNVFK